MSKILTLTKTLWSDHCLFLQAHRAVQSLIIPCKQHISSHISVWHNIFYLTITCFEKWIIFSMKPPLISHPVPFFHLLTSLHQERHITPSPPILHNTSVPRHSHTFAVKASKLLEGKEIISLHSAWHM